MQQSIPNSLQNRFYMSSPTATSLPLGHVETADFSPHDLRRTFVANALDAGIDIATVANIAGHASTDTTGVMTVAVNGPRSKPPTRLICRFEKTNGEDPAI
jgi:integrase